MHLRKLVPALALTLAALPGCKKDEPAPAPVAKEPVKPAEPPKVEPKKAEPAVDAAATASKAGESDRECVGAIDTAVPKQVTVGGKKAELNGYKLTLLDKDADDEARFGVIASINEDSPANLANLEKLVAWFKEQKAEALIVDGDIGDSEASITRSLGALASSGLPVFAMLGNHECKADYSASVVALQKKHDNLIDLGRVRYIDWDDADLVSLPGYHDAQYTHCQNGGACIYTKGDVAELEKVLGATNDTAVLVAHGTPHGTAATAIDTIEGGKHIGDPNLNALIEKSKVQVGIFANVKEAGGRATDLSGETVIKEGVLAAPLFLDPGPADSVAWGMNDGTTSTGMAALLTVKGKQASYQMKRLAKLTDAELAEANKKFAVPAAKPAADEKAAPAKK